MIGRVPAGKTIALSSLYGIWQEKLTTDKQGHFSERLAPGKYTFTYGKRRQPVRVPEGTSEITLKPMAISRGLGFAGEIVNQDEKPVTNAWFRAAADRETILLKRISDTGEFDVWQSDLTEMTSWSVRAGSRRYPARLIQKVPP